MEYKFKAKRVDNGEWVYGNLIDNKYIVITNAMNECDEYRCFGTDECYKIIPETIGQYTRLKDKNGKEIYSGDIVEYINKYRFIVCFGEYNKNPRNCAEAIVSGVYLKEIETKEIEPLYSINGVGTKFPAYCAESKEGIESLKLEVIGNTTDNLELLKEDKQ